MTIAISTSSPMVSVALFNEGGLLASAETQASKNASEIVLTSTRSLLTQASVLLKEVRSIVVDRGPGSFTGVKVGAMIGKVWAHSNGCTLFAVDSFDLVDPNETVLVPYRRNSYLIRRPGEAPIFTDQIPPESFAGYGIPNVSDSYPLASAAWTARSHWVAESSLGFVPKYVVEPSISVPKVAYVSPIES